MSRELYPMDREDCLARFAAMEKRIAALEKRIAALEEAAPTPPDDTRPTIDGYRIQTHDEAYIWDNNTEARGYAEGLKDGQATPPDLVTAAEQAGRILDMYIQECGEIFDGRVDAAEAYTALSQALSAIGKKT